MKQWLIRRLKKAGENIESTLTQLFFLALFGGSVAILALSKKALHFALQLAIAPTPLWATISLALLCSLYVYLKTRSYTLRNNESKTDLSQTALNILTFFGKQSDTCSTTKKLSEIFKITFNQTQFAIDELLRLNFLYTEIEWVNDQKHWLSTEGREFLGKENLL